jgi:hypothetical protein
VEKVYEKQWRTLGSWCKCRVSIMQIGAARKVTMGNFKDRQTFGTGAYTRFEQMEFAAQEIKVETQHIHQHGQPKIVRAFSNCENYLPIECESHWCRHCANYKLRPRQLQA